jgi:hypothetical protein
MKCPNCGADIKWSWCHDEYIINGKFVEGKTMVIPKGCNYDRVEVVTCDCGVIISTIILNDDGCLVLNAKEFDVDWADNDNAYGE